ncbi:MAG: hypothetical protein P8K77_00465 [Polaribacter sp.]|nr:hypothetical protein [Polaribacter sp.]
MIKKKLLSYIAVMAFCIYSSPLLSQIDSLKHQLNLGSSSYRSGDYATSILAFQKAVELSEALKSSEHKKDSLLLVSLKKLITVAGIGKAKELSYNYFNTYHKTIYHDICSSKNMVLKIGIINNYIGISVYNEDFIIAVNAYEDFINTTKNCPHFSQIDLIQSSANAAMAYSKINKPDKAIEILPQLNYFKDSIPNFTTADYNKVLGYVNANTKDAPEVIIPYYLKSANNYTAEKRYAYALDLYENLSRNYSRYMTNDELLELIKKSKKVRDSTKYYHNELYHKLMGQLGVVMLERTNVKERNTNLKTTMFYFGYGLTLLLILSLLFLIKKNRDSKNYYKKLYNLEKQFEIQQEKLYALKNNFIRANYTFTNLKSSENYATLFKGLKDDFPGLVYNIYNRFKNLTEKEVQIIYCTVLNLSTKESAAGLAMTHGAFRVAKNRLIKKVGIKNAEDFQNTVKKLI